eukprot:1176160-Prorocentrum_minimum.AAC.8
MDVQLWDLSSVKMLKEFRGHTSPVYSLATPSPPGEKRHLVISTSRERSIRVSPPAPPPAPIRVPIRWHPTLPAGGFPGGE